MAFPPVLAAGPDSAPLRQVVQRAANYRTGPQEQEVIGTPISLCTLILQ